MADEPDPREASTARARRCADDPRSDRPLDGDSARPPLTSRGRTSPPQVSRPRVGGRRAGLDDWWRDARWCARLPAVRLPAATLALPRRRSRDLRRHHGAEPVRGRREVGTDRADRQGGRSGRDQPVALGDLHRDLPRPRLRRRDALPGDRDRACDRLARLRPRRSALAEGIRCLQRRRRRAVRRHS